ncbi:MAG: hypothetical protein KatS3mg119_0025 [Rhodothalassiaceae bacterium]|nr:MAG: hypothetical protein KatS3mg119_0025 [Rhodothalassiaceae bacterium]
MPASRTIPRASPPHGPRSRDRDAPAAVSKEDAVSRAAARWARFGFPLVALRFEAVAQDPWLTPEFAGSVLRGSFGRALRRLVCMTGMPACDGCALLTRCPYPAIFMPPATDELAERGMREPPVPYAFAPPPFGRHEIAPGRSLVFGITLVGPATRRIAHVVEAMRRALARGLGSRRARFRLARVDALADPFDAVFRDPAAGPPDCIPLYDFVDETAETEPIDAAILDGPQLARLLARRLGGLETGDPVLTIHHDTPLRLKRHGRILDADALSPADLLLACWRRRCQLEAACGDPDAAPARLGDAMLSPGAIPVTARHLVWTDWKRRSSRQRRVMTLGGIRGRWTWRPHPAEAADLAAQLAAGALLHVGKETSFGFGRMRIAIEGGRAAAPPPPHAGSTLHAARSHSGLDRS